MSVNENGMTILFGNSKRNPQLDEVITVMGEASAKVIIQNLKLGIKFEISNYKSFEILLNRLEIIHKVRRKSNY